jgi:hypothetical protein
MKATGPRTSWVSLGGGLVACVMPVALAIGSGSHVRGVNPGVGYTFTITHHGLNADGKAADYEVVAAAQVSGDKVWVQYFQPPQNAGNNEPDADRRANPPKHYGYGAYYLFDRGNPKMTVVSPLKKKYFEMDQSAVLKQFSAVINVKFGNPVITVSRVQPDTMIDEVSTQHWRIDDSHSETVTVIGIPSTSQIHSTFDYYFSPALSSDFNPFLRTDDFVVLAGPGDYSTKMRAALDQMAPGIPVLMVERRSAGKGVQSSTVKRVSSIDHPDVKDSLFVIPAGFQKAPNDGGFTQESAWLPDSLTTPLPKKEPGLLSKLHIP